MRKYMLNKDKQKSKPKQAKKKKVPAKTRKPAHKPQPQPQPNQEEQESGSRPRSKSRSNTPPRRVHFEDEFGHNDTSERNRSLQRSKHPITKLNIDEVSPDEITEIEKIYWSLGHQKVVSKIEVKRHGSMTAERLYIKLDDFENYPSRLLIDFMKGLIEERVEKREEVRQENERRVQGHMKEDALFSGPCDSKSNQEDPAPVTQTIDTNKVAKSQDTPSLQ